MSEALDRMARQAPEDDRVWLGRAALATASGRYDEADRVAREVRGPRGRTTRTLCWPGSTGPWTQACPEALPRPRPASPHPAFRRAEVAAVIARLAALRGDRGRHARHSNRQVELEPGDTAAWDRLAELAVRDGSPDRAARLPPSQGRDESRS